MTHARAILQQAFREFLRLRDRMDPRLKGLAREELRVAVYRVQSATGVQLSHQDVKREFESYRGGNK